MSFDFNKAASESVGRIVNTLESWTPPPAPEPARRCRTCERCVRGTTDDPVVYCEDIGVLCFDCSRDVVLAWPRTAQARFRKTRPEGVSGLTITTTRVEVKE